MDYITEIYITVLQFMTMALKLSLVKDRHVSGPFFFNKNLHAVCIGGRVGKIKFSEVSSKTVFMAAC